MIVALFTGSREWSDKAAVQDAFDHAAEVDIHHVVTGDQRGLDRLAYEVARERKLHVVPVHAFWNEDGKAAGTIRNFQMIDVAIHLAAHCAWLFQMQNYPAQYQAQQFVHGYAFPMSGSIGTWNCVDSMQAQGITCDLRGTSPRRGQ